MKIPGILHFLILVIVLTACTTLRKASGTSSGYSENITGLRPKYDDKLDTSQQKDTLEENNDPQIKLEPQRDVTEKLDELLDDIIQKMKG